MLYVHSRSVLVEFVLWCAVCCAFAGMLQPTSGTAYIGGHDIRTNMSAIRESLGICPQFDILWPDITVAEHLQLYAVIKGATYAQAGMQAQQAAAEVSPAMHALPGSVGLTPCAGILQQSAHTCCRCVSTSFWCGVCWAQMHTVLRFLTSSVSCKPFCKHV